MIDQSHKPSWSFKRFLIKFVTLIGLIILCLSSVGFIIFGGYLKSGFCKLVLPGSYLHEAVSCSNVSETQQPNTENGPIQSKKFDQIIGDEGTRVADIVEEVAGGVVGIGVVGDNFTEDRIIGTGFLVSTEGILVTNRHVVEDEQFEYFLSFKNEEQTVAVPNTGIFRDPVNDIALIKIEKNQVPGSAKVLNIGDSSQLRLGQTVIAIGNPLGTYTGSITKGIISGLNREVSISQGFFTSQSEVYEDVIQTDAAINPGNSGGPLLNLEAEVIGVNFATVEGASNLSFALPINRIKARLIELQTYGKFKIPYFGVEYRTRLVFFKGQSLVGAEVLSVVKDSPAALSGIKAGDIIIEFDGTDFNDKTLSVLIQEQQINDEVYIVIIRNRVEQELKITIGER
jgi:S1-C subfamily serine protease